MIDWEKVTDQELDIIGDITKRAVKELGIQDAISLYMDITAAHINCPIKLDELLKADNFNFAHDVSGIQRHIDRNTGELTNCFVPRYAT